MCAVHGPLGIVSKARAWHGPAPSARALSLGLGLRWTGPGMAQHGLEPGIAQHGSVWPGKRFPDSR